MSSQWFEEWWCVCQRGDRVAHRHYSEWPHRCGRCLACSGYRPDIPEAEAIRILLGPEMTEEQAATILLGPPRAAPLPASAARQELEALIAQMRRDADAHRREAAAFRRLSEVAIRPACVCEDVLAQVHEYFADQLTAALRGIAAPPPDQEP